jgi:hypothetical protein
MNILKKLFMFFLLISVCLLAKTDGTTGLPLGGIGTGAVKYAGGSGTFAANFRTPTRDGNYQSLDETQFQLFIQRGDSVITDDQLTALQNSGRVDDDAIFPLHWVNFGELNDVSVEMTAYMPYYPDSVPMMCHPSAMFEFEIENLESSEVTVALAFQISTPVTPTAITDTGFTANGTSLELCLLGDFPGGTGDLSYGNDDGFFTGGLCDNNLSGTTNRLALRVSLSPSETRRVRFVLSWYQPDELEHYQYTNTWDNAKEVSVSTLDNFDTFKEKSEELVTRMRSSNLPDWLVDQTLNSLANLVNNSVYFEDGRYCHTEGQWSPEGTMDQMWHARQIYTLINPELAWQELEWWARTQHVVSYEGQIHHDFGTDFNYVGWDDTEHSGDKDIRWVDLNCGFIISVYEAFIATADEDKLSYFWPYVKKAAQRILDQVDLYGSSNYPYTFESSLSTYDAGGNSQAFNTGLSIVAYQIMTYLAEIMGETDVVTLYEAALDTAVTNFESRWLDNTYPAANYCESALGGPWIANFLKINPFWEKLKLDYLYITILNYYEPLSQGMGLPGGSYTEWQTYLIGHLGGYSLQTNRSNMWWALQKDMYDRNYLDRNLVFNQELGIPPIVSSPIWIATSTSAYYQYISIPILWRNYYNIAGYHYNKYSEELWLEPKLFDSLNHQLQDALVITPDGYVEISYNTYGEFYQNQEIVFTPDEALDVSAIYVWDLYSDSLDAIDFVRVDGIDTDYLRTGSGDLAHLKLDWSGTITPSGITIRIEGDADPVTIPNPPEGLQANALNSSQILLTWRAVREGVIGYFVEIDIDGVFHTFGTTALNDTSFFDTGLLDFTTYTYRIRSYNGQYISDPSAEIIVTTSDGGNGEVIYALNAGGDTYTSQTSGIEYINDSTTGWVSGGNTYSASDSIAGTEDDTLYQSERYADFSYTIPLENGSYDVVLKFAEIFWNEPGRRIFDVEVEGEEVVNDLDLIFRTDQYTAYDVVMPVNITDGELNVDFISVADNAKLSALEIRQEEAGLDEMSKIPANYFLSQNFPNPFKSTTRIHYGLPGASQVYVELYNVSGQRVRVLIDEKQEAGYHSVDFNAEDIASGIYFYKIKANDFSEIRKMVLVR